MKKESTKATEAQLLDLLKLVLPKATTDAHLANKIYDAVASELKAKAKAVAFDKFCAKVELPDLEPKTVMDVKRQLTDTFGAGNVALTLKKEEGVMTVDVSMPDGEQITREIKVRPLAPETDEEQEVTMKFLPFPICMPGDKELVWYLARRESMTPEEGQIALSKVEEEFWASKGGQKLLRDRVERSFPEFISRVPAGMLTDLGLKRHYKTPEPIEPLRAPSREEAPKTAPKASAAPPWQENS